MNRRKNAKNRRAIKKYWRTECRKLTDLSAECIERAEELEQDHNYYGSEYWEEQGRKYSRQADEAWRRYIIA